MLHKRIASFRYAFQGIGILLKTQIHARFHALAALGVVVAAWYFEITALEWAVLALTIGGVFAAEGFNTALEFLTDLVSPDFHELAGKTKDVAAAAVLLMAFAAIAVALAIFGPKIVALIR
jgi:diacylglycerol kinase (ATP)